MTFSLRFLALLVVLPAVALADDWPGWRYDAGRTAASPQELAPKLHLQWIREYPRLKPAWPDQPRMQFDSAYEPVVLGRTMYVSSSATDSVTALDTRTGAEKWRFYADGPVRFSPLAWEGKLYVVSDDGFLYCLDAERGGVLWKFRGGPADRRILGNERLISTWPARGAPVIADGTVYFAAGIWPFMGIFLYALDARTGKAVWVNDGDSAIYVQQPHRADAFAGVAPQGHLVVLGDRLLVPGGRSIPAIYDRATGKLLNFAFVQNSKKGGADVAAKGDLFFSGGSAFELSTGLQVGETARQLVLSGDLVYHAGKDGDILSFKPPEIEIVHGKDKKGKPFKKPQWKKYRTETIETPRYEVLIRAGSRFYGGGREEVWSLDPSAREIAWKAEVQGTVATLLAADERLFAVTLEGRIHCFGPDRVEPKVLRAEPVKPDGGPWKARARAVLETAGVREGYGVAWGAGTGGLVRELARESSLRIVVVEPDERKVDALRRELTAAGLYGERISVHAGDPLTFSLPPYLASLMVSEELADLKPEFAAKAFAALRPYGGVACLPVPAARRRDFGRGLEGAEVKDAGEYLLLRRPGALPGSANWTHEHADASNTRVSKDAVVRAPLGLLWFGGPSHEGILPRHGHGPQPQVIDGRLIIEGVDLLRALDIYTGRLLWEAPLPGVGRFYNNTSHQPGANAAGTNYISTSDGIYAAYGKSCVRLDPATGRKTREFALPSLDGKSAPVWGYINVFDRYLVGGAEPLMEAGPIVMGDPKNGDDPDPEDEDAMKELLKALTSLKGKNDNFSSSKTLSVMDRHTGEAFWTAKARAGFRHNAVCAGGGRLFAIDRLSGPQLDRLKRRGEKPSVQPRLVAFDLKTGRELWSTEADVFGTWLSYSAEHDVLVEAGRRARDTLNDEAKGMRAYRGSDGTVLWDEDHSGPAMIHGRTILMEGKACDLLTGELKKRQNPLTGLSADWIWSRNYGCNTPMASQNLLTFRSGAAGFFDLLNDGGTGNFGGFRSSCTNNLIVAGGILTAPDYTRTCSCSYQNQTSIALIHDPAVEMWTFLGSKEINGPLRRLGLNLAAPGDRRAEDGTLWVEHPSVGGNSPAPSVKTVPEKPETFRRHASRVEGKGNWIGASGMVGLQSLKVTLDKESSSERSYTVRLYFAEPEERKAGERLFNVSLQGREVLRQFDVAKEAGGPLRTIAREFRGIRARKDLEVTFAAVRGDPLLCGIELVEEKP